MQFRIHGITTDFIDELIEHGFEDLDADDLIQAKIHGRWWRGRRR